MRSNQHFQQFNVRASKSKLVFFFCSFHSCLIHYFSNNSFVLLTFFSHHLWVNKVKRRTGILVLGIVIRRSAKRSLLLHLTLLCQFLRCSYISTLNFYCYILRYVANFFAAVFFHQRQTCLLVVTFHCSTNTEVFCYIFLCVVNSLLCQFLRCSVPPTFICIVSCASFLSINDSRFFLLHYTVATNQTVN